MRMQTRSGASRASVLSRTTSAGGASPARAEPRRAGSVGEDRQRRYYIFLGADTFCVRPLSVAEHVLFHVVHRQFPQAMTLCQRHKRYEGGARVHAQEGGAGNDGRRLRSAAQTNITVSPLLDHALRPWSRLVPPVPRSGCGLWSRSRTSMRAICGSWAALWRSAHTLARTRTGSR